jgi:flagellar basal-body rod protein FlgB
MIGQIESATIGIVKSALDAASLRHLTIAQNIANANSPGFIPHRVSFEEQFDSFASRLASGESIRASELAGVHPTIDSVDQVSGDETESVKLDIETVHLAQNTVQYQALLKGISKKMSVINAAINEGKR